MTPFRVGHLEFRLVGELPPPGLRLASYVEHTWWQMAHVPSSMQADFGRDVQATYTAYAPYRQSRGQFTILNSEHVVDNSGRTRLRQRHGLARQSAAGSPLFEVTFTEQPQVGAYEIIGLASPTFMTTPQPYYSMAVVGEPTRRLLWVLCSQRQCSNELFEACLELARRAGYSEHVLDWRAPMQHRDHLLRTPYTEAPTAKPPATPDWLLEVAKRPLPPSL